MHTSLLAIALVLLPTMHLSASEWQIKPFIGATFGGSTTIVQPDLVGGDIASNPKLAVGVASSWTGEIFGIEGDIGHTPGFFNVGTRLGASLVRQSAVTTYTGNVVIALPRHMTEYTLRPYIVGGGGLMHVNLEDARAALQTGSDNLWAIDVGGGVTGFLTDHIGVSWDIRRFSAIGGQSGVLFFVPGASEQLSFWRANMSIAIRPIRRVHSSRSTQ